MKRDLKGRRAHGRKLGGEGEASRGKEKLRRDRSL